MATAADTSDAPFVAAFDRFFRDGSGDPLTAGRLLLGELSCTACHVSEDPQLLPKRGPNLDGAGRRYQVDWLRRYLASPSDVHPGTTMPDVLHGLGDDRRRKVVDAIVAFLSAQEPGFPTLVSTAGNPIAFEFWRKGNRDRGGDLYHQIGCVACHEPNPGYPVAPYQGSDLEKLLAHLDPEEIEELGLAKSSGPVQSVGQGDLSGKHSLQSLTFFLLDPARTRPETRMPNFKLNPGEAADIVAYLIGRDPIAAQPPREMEDASLVETGRRYFVEFRCAQCHAADDLKPSVVAKPLVRLHLSGQKNCITAPQAGLPNFRLDSALSQAIRFALVSIVDQSPRADADSVRQSNSASQGNSVTQDRASEAASASLRMMKLNCYACHERDQQGGVGPQRRRYFETATRVDLGDEGRLPPPLDGVGRKLNAPSLQKAVNGAMDVRPHMLARMPKFAAKSVAPLPTALTRADSGDGSLAGDLFGDGVALASAGRTLFDTGCVQCHPIRGERLPGVVGIDLAGVDQRVLQRWFHDFLLDPAEVKPRTRMPTFFASGRSANQEILDGNVELQIAALWTYIREINKQPLPQKIVTDNAHDFKLVPLQRPIVFRTFMKDVGTHAVAVGFPQRVHFVIDAENACLTQAWRGGFLDAHGTWFDRFTPPAVPLGDERVRFPTGVPFAVLPTDKTPWPKNAPNAIRFRGYRLGSTGVPTFLYSIDGFEIEDQIAPNEQSGLTRAIHIKQTSPDKPASDTLWFRGNVTRTTGHQNGNAFTSDNGLTVTVPRSVASRAVVRKFEGVTEWIMPVRVDGESSLEVNYRW